MKTNIVFFFFSPCRTGCLKVDAISDDGHYLVSLTDDPVSAVLPT